jgi:UDP-glucose 4-epimerase
VPNKTTLVTGGAGFIGSHLTDRLLSLGHRVVVVDDLSAGNSQKVPAEATFYKMDVRDPRLSDVIQKERVQVIFHEAAQPSVPASMDDPIKDAEINIIGSINVLEAARRHNLERFIFASSGGAVYGEPQYLPCDEMHPILPLSPYGAGKHAVEGYLRTYAQTYGMEYNILRYANVYGPGQTPLGETGVIPIFLRAMMGGSSPVIFGSGEQERDFIYIKDVVEATILAMEGEPGQVYNIGSGLGTQIVKVFSILKELTNYPGNPTHVGQQLGGVSKIHLDITKARRELNWRPEIPLETGLLMVVDQTLVSSAKE